MEVFNFCASHFWTSPGPRIEFSLSGSHHIFNHVIVQPYLITVAQLYRVHKFEFGYCNYTVIFLLFFSPLLSVSHIFLFTVFFAHSIVARRLCSSIQNFLNFKLILFATAIEAVFSVHFVMSSNFSNYQQFSTIKPIDPNLDRR